VPGRREVKEANKLKYTKMVLKMGGFPRFLALKSPKMPFFALKYLIRYTPKMFYEEYINFNIFCYLRHCGVIPV
jgi:hypothetical protein